MARLFNLKVFEMTLGGSATTPTAVYSDQSLEATFGSAELLTVQFIIEGGAEDSTTVTLNYEHSNDARNWQQLSTKTLALGTKASGLQQVFYTVAGDETYVWGAFGRFSLTADKPGAVVRVIVCGVTAPKSASRLAVLAADFASTSL